MKSNLPVDDKWIQQIALPRVLRLDALNAYHDSSAGGAHLGIERVMAAMKMKYHWPRMHQEIYDYIHSISVNASNETPMLETHPLLHYQ